MRTNNLTDRIKKADLYRIQGDNIAIIGTAYEALHTDKNPKNFLYEIIGFAQKSNAFLSRYEPKKALELNSNQIKLFRL